MRRCLAAVLLISIVLTTAGDRAGAATTAGLRCDVDASTSACHGRRGLQSAEAELAQRYAPIVFLKEQSEPCDGAGEGFAPVEVQAVLGNPDVTLRNATNPSSSVDAPQPSDLYGLGDGYYLDFPNSPKNPGCRYEEDFRAFEDDVASVAYAHITSEAGEPGIVLQYWFYYYFNDWNNNHESDWEMIQLVFDAGSAEEALGEEPVRVGYSQHSGGERADWDDDKLRRDGDRPHVYVAAGSHSNQFDSENYLGRAEEGAGFGCDDATGPHRRIEPEVRVVPSAASGPDDPNAWVSYEGRWGEQLSGEFNGPTGPNTKRQWEQPIAWQEDLRGSNVQVPAGRTAGPSPANVFCGVVAFVSDNILTFVAERPWLSLIAVGLILGAGATTAARTSYEYVPVPIRRRRKLGQILRTSLRMVLSRPVLFAGIAAAFLPAGALASSAQAFIASVPPVAPLLDLADPPRLVLLLVGASTGAAFFGAAYLIVVAGVTAAIPAIERGEHVTAIDAYRVWLRNFPTLFLARLQAAAIVLLLAFTIVGIPWAIKRGVDWLFIEQAVLLDGHDRRSALTASARVARGGWWRAFGIATLLVIVSVAAGPVLTAPLLLFTTLPLELLNLLSSIIYVIVVPVAAVGLTLLYADLADRAGATPTSQAPLGLRESIAT